MRNCEHCGGPALGGALWFVVVDGKRLDNRPIVVWSSVRCHNHAVWENPLPNGVLLSSSWLPIPADEAESSVAYYLWGDHIDSLMGAKL